MYFEYDYIKIDCLGLVKICGFVHEHRRDIYPLGTTVFVGSIVPIQKIKNTLEEIGANRIEHT